MKPCWGRNVYRVPRYCSSDCSMPIARPATVAHPSDDIPPIMAAANPDTTKSAKSSGEVGTKEATSAPNTPATAPPMAQLTPPTRLGRIPSTVAPVSVSAAVVVIRPKRVLR